LPKLGGVRGERLGDDRESILPFKNQKIVKDIRGIPSLPGQARRFANSYFYTKNKNRVYYSIKLRNGK